jgi:hypothetical protein
MLVAAATASRPSAAATWPGVLYGAVSVPPQLPSTPNVLPGATGPAPAAGGHRASSPQGASRRPQRRPCFRGGPLSGGVCGSPMAAPSAPERVCDLHAMTWRLEDAGCGVCVSFHACVCHCAVCPPVSSLCCPCCSCRPGLLACRPCPASGRRRRPLAAAYVFRKQPVRALHGHDPGLWRHAREHRRLPTAGNHITACHVRQAPHLGAQAG